MFSDQTQNSVAWIITIMEWLAVSFFVLSLSLSLLCPQAFSFCFCSSFNAYQSLRKTDRQSQETGCEQASVHEDVCVSCSHIKCMRNLYVRMWEREGQSVHACVYACLCKPSHAHAGAWERESEQVQTCLQNCGHSSSFKSEPPPS